MRRRDRHSRRRDRMRPRPRPYLRFEQERPELESGHRMAACLGATERIFGPGVIAGVREQAPEPECGGPGVRQPRVLLIRRDRLRLDRGWGRDRFARCLRRSSFAAAAPPPSSPASAAPITQAMRISHGISEGPDAGLARRPVLGGDTGLCGDAGVVLGRDGRGRWT